MKEILKSILSEGRFSSNLNEFIDLSFRIALASFNSSILRESILTESGLSSEDIAYDIIADLFKEEAGKFIYINNYFDKISKDIDKLENDYIKSKIAALIISRTNQRLYEIKEDYGEIYYKIRKAIRIYIQRNKTEFKKIIINEESYLYNCKKMLLNFDIEQYPKDKLLQNLFTFDYRNYSVPEVVHFSFKILNEQDYYNKSISESVLYNVVSDFFKQRLKNYSIEFENVSYIKYDDDKKIL